MQISNNLSSQDIYLDINKSLDKISSGQALTQSSSNAASLAIGENLNTQSNGLLQAVENVNAGSSLVQIADKAIEEQSNILDTVKEKLLQASTDTTSQDGRDAILKEIKGLLENLDNIASSTNYNGKTLLQNSDTDSSASQGLQFQAGDSASSTIQTEGVQANTEGIGLSSLVSQDEATFTSSSARSYLDDIDNAISSLNSERSEFGSVQNQLQSSSSNLFSQHVQTQNAASNLLSVDYASEISNFSKQNIMAQVGAFAQAQGSGVNAQTVTRLLS